MYMIIFVHVYVCNYTYAALQNLGSICTLCILYVHILAFVNMLAQALAVLIPHKTNRKQWQNQCIKYCTTVSWADADKQSTQREEKQPSCITRGKHRCCGAPMISIPSYTHIYLHTYIHTQIHTYTFLHIHTYSNTPQIHAYTYINTHTHA